MLEPQQQGWDPKGRDAGSLRMWESVESLSPVKMEAGEGFYTEHMKSPSLTSLVPDWEWDHGKAGTCLIEIKMAQGEVLD